MIPMKAELKIEELNLRLLNNKYERNPLQF